MLHKMTWKEAIPYLIVAAIGLVFTFLVLGPAFY